MKKTAIYEQQLKSAVSQEELQQIKAGLDDTVGEISKAVKLLPQYVRTQVANPNGLATQNDIKNFVSQDTYQGALNRIVILEKNSPKEQLKTGLIYFAKQGALGCVSYQLSPHMASLLRSLKLENRYVDLETFAVPTTTFAVSLLARLAKEVHDKRENASLQEVGKESLLDAGASVGVIGLRYICFDKQMNEYFDQMAQQNRTAGYAFGYAVLRSLIALFI